ncbi:Endonuclease/exonuclease/phosphatase [Earliella scabrosa]|nr:Endonuclease/exonuclease/phosphatase [Earliella scabrosa]
MFTLRALLALALAAGLGVVHADERIRLATYNIRQDVYPNSITVQQSIDSLPDPLKKPTIYYGKVFEQPWSTRRIKVYQHLRNEGIVLAGFQEALIRQVNDLAELFGDDWAWVGVGRDDGIAKGEFNPIFYKKSAFELVSNDTFWLSNTPFEPSKYPGAGSTRICTVTRLTLTSDPTNNTPLTLLNTHLDNLSSAQRALGASLLLLRARHEAHATRGPVLLSGDLNSPPSGSGAGAYQILTGQAPPVAINATFAARYAVPEGVDEFRMLDLRAETPRVRVSGEHATYTGFGLPFDTSAYSRIDFLFAGSNGQWSADAYRVGSSLTDDGVLASDHRPVFADVTLQ